MSRVVSYRCDRCGDIIAADKPGEFRLRNYEMRFVSTGDHLDLCPGCYTELDEWMHQFDDVLPWKKGGK